MVRAVTGHDLLPPGDHARDPDGVLVGLGAAEREEEAIEIARCELGEHAAEPRAHGTGHPGAGIDQLVGLALDRFDDALVAVADVHAHEHRRDVGFYRCTSARGGPAPSARQARGVDALGVCRWSRGPSPRAHVARI